MIRVDYAANQVEINEDIEKVFDFIARLAQYPRWHMNYHMRREWVDVREGGVNSVFRIEELIYGFDLVHVGKVRLYDRPNFWEWHARFALNEKLWIGTKFEFKPTANGTLVKEILFYEYPWYYWPLYMKEIRLRTGFKKGPSKGHIRRELTGCKVMIESGDHDPEDITDLFDPAVNKDPNAFKHYKAEEERSIA